MFSQISSFLSPSVLTPVVEKSNPTSPQPSPSIQETENQSDKGSPPESGIDELGVKKRKERSSEAFIVVRPPPSKTNHPLNLQVQLVPPSSRENNRSTSSRRSIDEGSNEVTMEPLVRTTSNRSEVSSYSSYSTSQASITSVGSSSASSGRRMIIPLYNLQAHNVMTNVIVDAGTDAKVAKFMRRGLEVIGLAILEPMEVWGHGGTGFPLMSSGSARTSMDAEHLRPSTPGSSAISLSSAGHAPPTPLPPPTPVPPPSPQTANGAKRFFGKIFKKKEGSTPTGSITSLVQVTSPLLHPDVERIVRTPTKRNSLLLPIGHNSLDLPTTPSGQVEVLQPPVLGIQPTLNATTFPPRGRPTSYVWTVTRWLKGSPDSLLGGMKGMFLNDRREEPVELESIVEVRIEWLRGKSGDRKRKRDGNGTETNASRRNSVALTASNSPSTSSLVEGGEQPSPKPIRQKQRRDSISKGRASVDSQRPRDSSPHNRGSIHTNTTTSEHDHGDNGDESDPEDSEVPWTCSIVVRKIGQNAGGSQIRHHRSSSAVISPMNSPIPLQPQQQIRLKIATVSPTPHHPKVVSLLKIPFPLPDIEIANVRLRKRVVTPAGVARPVTASATPTKSPGMFGSKEMKHVEDGLILTAEEIKDIVATTGLWLVVREGMGGVGKVGRKGDGWKLRG